MRWTLDPRAVFVALALIYLAVGVWTTRRVAATGDEPHYFMAADALLHGEGFELTDRWLVLESAPYSPGDPISADEFRRTTAPSRSRPGSYPIHDLGLPLLMLAPLALGGRWLVVAAIAVAMAGAVALGMRTARALGASRARALAGATATGLTVPALTYSGQVFPDAVAPLPVAAAFAALVGAAPRWWLGIALAALPVLHVRYWPIAVGLLVASVVLERPRARDVARLLAPLAIVIFALAALDLVVYGVPLPHAGFLLFFSDRRIPLETYGGVQGIAGLFVDRAFGLIPAAPIAGLLFAGAGLALRHPRERALALVAVPYLVVVPFVDWTGGFSPQARYFAPLVPLVLLLYALAFSWRPAALAAIPVALWTAGQSAIYIVAPWLRYDAYGVPPLADRAWSLVVGVRPSAIFPLFGADGATPVPTFVWCVALLALFAAGAARDAWLWTLWRSRPGSRPPD